MALMESEVKLQKSARNKVFKSKERKTKDSAIIFTRFKVRRKLGLRFRTYLQTRKKTKKVPQMFLEVKVLTEREELCFWTLSRNNQGLVYLFSFEKPQNKKEKRSTVVERLKAKYE